MFLLKYGPHQTSYLSA